MGLMDLRVGVVGDAGSAGSFLSSEERNTRRGAESECSSSELEGGGVGCER